MDATVGTVLSNRYELREVLGRGGMGAVYLAFDRELERQVAIKSLLPHLARDPELVARFRREGQALARLRHSGIIALFDMLRSEDALYLVLEYVPGRPLDRALQAGPLGWPRVVEIGVETCDALEAAHAEGIIHRDIKPSNILLERTGRVRVADFGLARLAGASLATRTGVSMGTPGYWAPEQALGKASTPRTDVYSLCCVLFEAATGRLPFVAEDDSPAAAFMHVAAPVPDPREVNPSLPEAASEILMRGLAKDPAERQSSAAALAAELRRSVGMPPPSPVPTEMRLAMAPQPPLATPPGPTEAAGAAGAGAAQAGPTEHAGERRPEPTAGAAPDTEAAGAGEGPGTEAGAAGSGPATPPAPPAPPTGRRPVPARRRVPAGLAAAAALVVTAAVAAGLVAGMSGGGGGDDATAEAPDPARERAGALSIEIPPTWEPMRRPEVPGVQLPGATLSHGPPEGAGDAQVLAGMVQTGGPALLPPDLIDRIPRRPAAEAVRLGPLEALRYRELEVDGLEGDVLTVYAVPTDRGVATVMCLAAPQGAAAFRTACDGAAATLRLTGARAFGLGPDPAYARTLDTALRRLSARRADARRRLARAPLPAGQAAAAAALSDAYRAARERLAGAPDLGPAGRDRAAAVVAAVTEAQNAASALAVAAGEGRRAAYDAARRRLAAADRGITAAVRGLRPLGYRSA